MPAKSKAQQRFFGMVYARKKGKKVGGKKVAEVAKSISLKNAEEFASTKHKGLPNHVKEKKKKRKAKNKKQTNESSLWQQWKMMREMYID